MFCSNHLKLIDNDALFHIKAERLGSLIGTIFCLCTSPSVILENSLQFMPILHFTQVLLNPTNNQNREATSYCPSSISDNYIITVAVIKSPKGDLHHYLLVCHTREAKLAKQIYHRPVSLTPKKFGLSKLLLHLSESIGL